MPDGTFDVILADPPWSFDHYSARGEGRNAKTHYRCPPLDVLKAYDVGSLASPNALLALWVTGPTMIEQAPALAAAWGFPCYSGVLFEWVKRVRRDDERRAEAARRIARESRVGLGITEARAREIIDEQIDGGWHMGLGYTTRSNPELVLGFWRGSDRLPRRDKGVRSLVITPVEEHSVKPDEVQRRLDQLFDGPKLELFARRRYPGWAVWGDGVESDVVVPFVQPV